ncbi:hypothetical protein KUTeg_019834 [Tegillarca granosa]|uniref:C2 domain-containing protein n=1 Tax=Tegillarca granosa TaxID=220873 RepID=A0ABQ9EDQ6_TEGGR|nr:hypothetical protein KUTeg_019834 [Tegillarca granosa]
MTEQETNQSLMTYQQGPVSVPSRGPVSKVELRIECEGLPKKDDFSKSDPCAVLFMFQKGNWIEMGRTENIENCHDPKFAKSFTIDYYFEEVQKIKIEVYDIDNSTPKLTDDDFLGVLECTVGNIRSEEVKEGGNIAYMTFSATKLDNKDFMGKSDPYLEISKSAPDGTWQVVHRTEVVKNTLNPRWRPFFLPEHTLCGGDKNRSIKVII